MEEATFLTFKEASLHGKLMHVSSIFILICPLLCSIAHFVSLFTCHILEFWLSPTLKISLELHSNKSLCQGSDYLLFH